MRYREEGNEVFVDFSSLEDMARVARDHRHYHHGSGTIRNSWHGVESFDEAFDLALNGWHEQVAEATRVAESAIDKVERDHEVVSFHPFWDVSGCEVDVSRYLAGEPENMIDYEMVPTTRVGRVITLCASITYSGSISARTIIKRGHVIAALAFALSKLGYQVELWATMDTGGMGARDSACYRRTLVKGANDELDPGKIMFAYSHPAMLRVLGFQSSFAVPEKHHSTFSIGGSYGSVINPKQNLPEGTIYLPSVKSDHDIPDADEELVRHMTELGIIEN